MSAPGSAAYVERPKLQWRRSGTVAWKAETTYGLVVFVLPAADLPAPYRWRYEVYQRRWREPLAGVLTRVCDGLSETMASAKQAADNAAFGR